MSFEAAWEELRNDVRVRRFGEIAAFGGSGAVGRVLLVGGCLRDAALGLATKDLDLVVERGAGALAARYRELTGATVVALGGERFAAIRVVEGGRWLDLLGLEGTTLDADLRRRDLTVNAIAVDVATGEVVDPADGRRDLERRLLRATRPGVFAEDPLRTLRLARFALTLPGFSIDPETEELARRAANDLDSVARERVRDELDRILGSPDLRVAAAWLDRLGLLDRLLGDAAAARWRDLAANGIPAVSEPPSGDPPPVEQLSRSWARLAAAGGDGPTGGRELLALARRHELLSNATFAAAAALLAPDWTLPDGDPALRWWIHSAGWRWRDAARLRGGLAREERERAAWRAIELRAAALSEDELRAIVEARPLVDGDEAGRLLGVAPGPALGAALAELRRAQVEGTVKSRAEAEAFLGLRRGVG